jgi:hypothetical protein
MIITLSSLNAGCHHEHKVLKRALGRRPTLLLEDGVDVIAKDGIGGTLLLWAAHNGNMEVKWLLSKDGIDVNAKDNANSPPLSYTVAPAKWLLEKGANPDSRMTTDGRHCHMRHKTAMRRWSSCCSRMEPIRIPRMRMDARRCHGLQCTGTQR